LDGVEPPFVPVVPDASGRGRLLSIVVVVGAVLLVGAAADLIGYAVATAAGFVVGALVGEVTGADRWFRTRPGLLMGMLTFLLLIVAGVFGAQGGLPLGSGAAGVLLAVPALVVGLDTRRVDRLRPLLVLGALAVLVAAWIEPDWMPVALVVWGLAAFGAFAVLEADRRAALPHVQRDDRGADRTRGGSDLLATIAISLGAALLAALLLSVPSCQRDGPELRPPGSFDGGSFRPDGSEYGGIYVPDRDGDVLVPTDGAQGEGGPREPIPVPERVPSPADGDPVPFELGSGLDAEVEVLDDGDRLVTVTGDDGQVWRYRLSPEGEGIRITRIGPDGRAERSWYYDPNAQIAVEGGDGDDAYDLATEDLAEPEPESGDDALPSIDWRLVGLVLATVALLAALVWWWLRRRARPDAPAPGAAPWAVALLARLDELGERRGRARRADESVTTYATALASGVVPDPSVIDIGEVLADALYGPVEVDPQRRRWAEQAVARLEASAVPMG
jgi:hypothetical protein